MYITCSQPQQNKTSTSYVQTIIDMIPMIHKSCLTFIYPRKRVCNVKGTQLEDILVMDIENVLTYAISQHWFREWLGASKNQAITWINADQILQSHQASTSERIFLEMCYILIRRGAVMFSLICVWINGWVNNHEAGDLRRHRGHYDVNVMQYWLTENWTTKN